MACKNVPVPVAKQHFDKWACAVQWILYARNTREPVPCHACHTSFAVLSVLRIKAALNKSCHKNWTSLSFLLILVLKTKKQTEIRCNVHLRRGRCQSITQHWTQPCIALVWNIIHYTPLWKVNQTVVLLLVNSKMVRIWINYKKMLIESKRRDSDISSMVQEGRK